MKIYSNNIKDGYLEEEFGNNAKNKAHFENGINTKSFHLAWSDINHNTKSLAIVFDDYDAIPVCGFRWIHWTVANLDPSLKELKPNASNELFNQLIQGKNSWASKLINSDTQNTIYQKYGGCAPPDKDHEYCLKVYCLDTVLNLKQGFYLNELIHAMKNHIIDEAILLFKYHQNK